ncbi:MAG: indole-3-glycerol-phosphate synthase TrpC, partial [Candidatus Marinimicrobia bacterium]|nr:indole-3-glycerol-phosphate synthase TrpC [Candidatus Neomarinimicrobiota bacterium]
SGADAILLIADALEPHRLKALYQLADSLGLHVLMEGYSDQGLAAIREIDPPVAGINSRDLQTMVIDLSHMLERIGLLPESALKVAESGIESAADLGQTARAGFDAALIGTSLLVQPDPGAALTNLLAELSMETAGK